MTRPLRIIGATACRSDYDLLSSVYKALAADRRFTFSLLVSGAHLSPRFGRTIDSIAVDNLSIAGAIETLEDSDAPDARPVTAAHWLIKSSSILRDVRPDAILAAGDREDALAACMWGAYARVPVAHFFGGDHGDTKDVDNLVRHACSKLASLHFVMTAEHADRLRAIGERNERILVVGNPALDAFVHAPTQNRAEVLRHVEAESIGPAPYAVLIHHPTFEDPSAGAAEVEMILDAFAARGVPVVAGLPNTDAGSRAIIDLLHARSSDGLYVYKGLPRREFINLLRHAALLVGNSSLGILEAPSIPLPVVNVGRRQKGRGSPMNVLFADATPETVGEAIDRAMAKDFRESLRGMKNPYGDGFSTSRIVEALAREIHPGLADKPFDPLVGQAPRA